MPRCLAAASIAAIALFAAAPEGRAASFDCSRAMKGVESAICEDRGLSALDDQMAQNYRALLNKTSGATEARIRADQKVWLRTRNACGDDARCLNREYRARIQSIAASGSGAATVPRETASAQETEEKPRGLFGRNTARAPEPAKPEPAKDEETQERPGLLARMLDRMNPHFGRKDDEPEQAAPPARQQTQRTQTAQKNQQAQDEQAAPQQPLKIVGQRPTAKTPVVETEPVVAAAEQPRRKSVMRITSDPQPVQPEPQLALPEPARQKSVSRQEIEPQVAAAEPVRQKFVLRPAAEQPQATEPAPTQLAARQPKQQGKWQDLPTGSTLSVPDAPPRTTTTRSETATDDAPPRVKTTRVKPEPVEEAAEESATAALTYAPVDEADIPAQRVLRQEPRVQMIKPLIVRDRSATATAPEATEPAAPAAIDEPSTPMAIEDETAAPVDETATAAIAPETAPAREDETATAAIAPETAPVRESETPAPEDHIPELAALPPDTLSLPAETETSPVKQALKNRFDTAYGSPNRIDLLAPIRQSRVRFDPGRFDIFNDPSGG